MPISSKGSAKSSFLSIPLEIRLFIYRYLVPNNPNACIWPKDEEGQIQKYDALRKDEDKAQPQMLLVCRQVYNEALPLFYESSIFQLFVDRQSFQFTSFSGSDIQRIAKDFSLVQTLRILLEFDTVGYVYSPFRADDIERFPNPMMDSVIRYIVENHAKLSFRSIEIFILTGSNLWNSVMEDDDMLATKLELEAKLAILKSLTGVGSFSIRLCGLQYRRVDPWTSGRTVASLSSKSTRDSFEKAVLNCFRGMFGKDVEFRCLGLSDQVQ